MTVHSIVTIYIQTGRLNLVCQGSWEKMNKTKHLHDWRVTTNHEAGAIKQN